MQVCSWVQDVQITTKLLWEMQMYLRRHQSKYFTLWIKKKVCTSAFKLILHLTFDTLRHLQCAEDEKVSRKLQVVCLNYCSFRVANYQSTYLMYIAKYNMYLAWEQLNPRRVDESGWIYFYKLLSWLRNWIWREEKSSISASSNSPPPPFDIIYFDLT